jgi:hypothetical protein
MGEGEKGRIMEGMNQTGVYTEMSQWNPMQLL